jgi:hypothetical protein
LTIGKNNTSTVTTYTSTKTATGIDNDQVFTIDADNTWQILGTSENGEITLISENVIYPTDISGNELSGYELKGSAGYEYSVNELNRICAVYGQGYGAITGRSVTMDDINSLTGYTQSSYNTGKIDKYGNEVKYYWNNNSKPYYETTNGLEGNLTNSHTTKKGFTYFDTTTNTWKTSVKPSSIVKTLITTLKSTYYTYKASDLNISTSSNIYNLIFDTDYWVATESTHTSTDTVQYGLFYVKNGEVNADTLYTAQSDVLTKKHGIRPVIVLNSNVELQETETSGVYTIK